MVDSATWHLVRQGQSRPFRVEGDVIVGRSKQADLQIEEGYVSRRHARLWIDDAGSLMVEDLGSANGTFINGRRIDRRSSLGPGDRVCFDETEFHVESHGGRSDSDPNATFNRPDEAADFKPERPDDWAPPPPSRSPEPPAPDIGATQPVSTLDPGEPPGTGSGSADDGDADLDFDLDFGRDEPPPPSRPSSPRPSPPSVSQETADFDLTEEPSIDLSIGSARPSETVEAPSAAPQEENLAATVAMGATPSAPPPASPAPAQQTGDGPGLLGLSGPVEGHLYQLGGGRISLGRAPESDIMIDEGSVSKRHAELMAQPGNVRIFDTSRSNGVFVNGNRVEDAALNPGDVVRLGRVEFMFDAYDKLADGGSAAGTSPWLFMVLGFIGTAALAAGGWLLFQLL
jgi:pSer/pThr/pTyr-binding forkhead associated (FHA) protein